jgi:hypothetical protein
MWEWSSDKVNIESLPEGATMMFSNRYPQTWGPAVGKAWLLVEFDEWQSGLVEWSGCRPSRLVRRTTVLDTLVWSSADRTRSVNMVILWTTRSETCSQCFPTFASVILSKFRDQARSCFISGWYVRCIERLISKPFPYSSLDFTRVTTNDWNCQYGVAELTRFVEHSDSLLDCLQMTSLHSDCVDVNMLISTGWP